MNSAVRTVVARRAVAGALLVLQSFVLCAAGQAESETETRTQLATMGLEVNALRLVQYAAQGDRRVVELLLGAGVPVGEPEPVRQITALHGAAGQGHVALTKMLLERGAPVDARDWNGATPLIFAAYHGRVETMRLLLERGAEIDLQPKSAPTALIAAVYSGNAQAVELLLRAGAKLTLPDAFGNAAATVAQTASRIAILNPPTSAAPAARQP